MRALSPEGEPHPVGSAANRRVRDRILGELRRLGYAPEVQATFACGRFAFCAGVENVVARLEGGSPGKALLVMAHYDGVPAGPGASDNLAAVATLLEAARVLAAGPPQPRPVVFLFTDGEEGGEIGSTAFAAGHRWSREIGAAINVDTRGTTGPSVTFETTRNDAWLVERLAAALPHPVASSAFVTIYRALPMDSDLSVLAERGVPGLNFACVRGAALYHTALDDLDHLDPASLQHHGDHVLATVRSLLAAEDSDLDYGSERNASAGDKFGEKKNFEAQISSEQALQKAKLAYDAAEAQERATVQRIEQAKANLLANKDSLRKTTLLAPINGVVCVDAGGQLIGLHRIKRPRRIAEKANRYIANWIFRMV